LEAADNAKLPCETLPDSSEKTPACKPGKNKGVTNEIFASQR
jgi:hypothetical protein